MQPDEFEKLQYGNVIADCLGNKFIALHVMRDGEGKATHVGLLPAIAAADAGEYTVVSKDHSETYLAGRSVQG